MAAVRSLTAPLRPDLPRTADFFAFDEVSHRVSVAPADAVFLNAKLEMDLMDMSPEDQLEMLEGFGASESGLDQLARTGFHTLGLQTYLTAGPKESRAWTIRQGWTAPQAAGVIHTDFQKGFDDLDDAGSMAAVKAAGKARLEGKDYVMQDGDVVEFRSGLTSGGKK